MPKDQRGKHWKATAKTVDVKTSAIPGGSVPSKEAIEELIDWLESIVEWGKNVRDDIVRLEGAMGIGAGDPGDPPPSPWKKI